MFFIHLIRISSYALPQNCVKNGTVALTIDEGPSVYTEEILDILKKENVKATFHFSSNIRGSEFDDIYDRALDEGHEIGMRTNPQRVYTNEDDYDDIKEDLGNQLAYFQTKIGEPIKFARSPLNGALPVNSVHKYFLEKKIIQTSYSYCPYDDERRDPEENLKEYLRPTLYKKDSFIIQLYDQRLGEDGNLKEIVKIIKENNYSFVTLSECLEDYTPGKAIQNREYTKSGSCSNKIMLSSSFIPILMYYLI